MDHAIGTRQSIKFAQLDFVENLPCNVVSSFALLTFYRFSSLEKQ